MRLTILIPFLFASTTVFSQSIQKFVIVDNRVDPGGMLDEIKLPPSGVHGTIYYEPEWNNGKVYLNSGQVLINFPIRYDVENHQIEIKTRVVVKVCAWNQYSKFEWQSNFSKDSIVFVNSNQFIYSDGTPPIGAIRILYDGKIKLLAMPYVKILTSNYAPTVDIGNRDHKMVHRDAFLLQYRGLVTKFDSKKELLDIIGSKSQQLKKYMKKNNLKASKAEDLTQAIEYLNTL